MFAFFAFRPGTNLDTQIKHTWHGTHPDTEPMKIADAEFRGWLEEIVNSDPQWEAHLMRNSDLRDPNDINFTSHAEALCSIFLHITISRKRAERVVAFASFLSAFATIFHEMRSNLGAQMELLGSTSEVAFLFATFLENQAILSTSEFEKAAIRDGYADVFATVQSIIKGRKGGNAISLVSAIETICEMIDLQLRYILRKQRPSLAKFDSSKHWFDNPAFKQIYIAGSTWLYALHLWDQVKFKGWLPTFRGDLLILAPLSQARELALSAAYRRASLFDSWIAQVALAGTAHTDTDELIEILAASISLPEVGQIWDGNIDFAALKLACAHPEAQILGEDYAKHRYYNSVLPNITLGAEVTVNWSEWLRLNCILRVFANAFARTVSKASAAGRIDINRCVLLASKLSINSRRSPCL